MVVTRQHSLSLSNKSESVAFEPQSGELVEELAPEGFARMFRRIFYGLHEAKFASPTLRALLFFMGVASTFLIASGLIMWLNKRLEKVKQRHLGHAVVERLNVSTIMGITIAIAGYFYANRLIPLDIAQRSAAEVNVFLLTWLIAAIYSVLRPIKKAWSELLLLAAVTYCALPLFDIALNSQWILDAIEYRNGIYLSVELSFIITGIICFMFYRFINREKKNGR